MNQDTLLLGMFGLGWPEIGIILGLITIMWGAKRLPMIARGIASIPLEFKKGRKEERPKPDERR